MAKLRLRAPLRFFSPGFLKRLLARPPNIPQVQHSETGNALILFLKLLLAQFAFKQYVAIRRRRRIQPNKPPPKSVKLVIPDLDHQEFQRSQQYALEKISFGFFADGYTLVFTLLNLLLAPLVWDGVALDSVLRLGLTTEYELIRMLAAAIFMAPFEFIVPLPISAYSTFVIERRFGFNNQTPKSWFRDHVKSFIVEQSVSLLLMSGLVILLRNLGPSGWIYLSTYVTVFILCFNIVYPEYVAPLFNDFTRLRDGPVRDGIESLVTRSGIACNRIFEVDGSRQSNHSNAYVAGLLRSKRIVIYDTLLEHLDAAPPRPKGGAKGASSSGAQDSSRETSAAAKIDWQPTEAAVESVCAVVAHEIGHSVMHHNWILLGATAMQFALIFVLFGACEENAAQALLDFGYKDSTSTFLTVQLFLIMYTQIASLPMTILMNAMTRQLEYAADAYSVKLGFDIRSSLKRISRTNLENLDPDPLDAVLRLSHPTTVQRVTAVTNLLKQKLK